jgi:prevent-host-death family protein
VVDRWEAAMVERTISATEARVHFGELLDSVSKRNDVVFVERAGVAQVVVVSVDEWQRRCQRASDPWAGVAEMMAEHWAYMREKYGDTLDHIDWAEEIRAGREERDEQIRNGVLGR